MTVRTIEADIQEKILNILPDNYETALEIMAQLSANICLSGKCFDVEAFCNKIRKHYNKYIEIDSQ